MFSCSTLQYLFYTSVEMLCSHNYVNDTYLLYAYANVCVLVCFLCTGLVSIQFYKQKQRSKRGNNTLEGD